MNRSRKKMIVVAGPTASGKTSYAIRLAKQIGGEIINADSRQVYRFMDIGTNKGNITITEAGEVKNLIMDEFEINPYEIEKSGVVGWLFNVVNPDEEFSVAHYQQLAQKVIENINSRGKVPILVGGTGLYVNSVIKRYEIDEIPPNHELREELEQKDRIDLQNELRKLNPELFQELNNSELNNKRRLIRMIEKSLSNTKSQGFNSDNKYKNFDYDFVYIETEKEELYEVIDKRAEEMFRQGFVDEVKLLIKMGYKDTKPMQGIGYRDVVKYLDGEICLEECIEKTKQGHRNYAKRQVTWFQKYK